MAVDLQARYRFLGVRYLFQPDRQSVICLPPTFFGGYLYI